MTIRDVLFAVRQRWWILLVCVALGTGVGAGIATTAPTTFTSLATVVVAVPGIDQSSMQPPGGINVTQRATNYAGIATGTRVLGAVVDELGLHTDPATLAQSVTIEIPSGTTLINISVQASSADRAQKIAQSVATNLASVATDLEGALGVSDPAVVLSVADPASLPETPDPRGTGTKAALGFLLGALVGAAALWFLEFADDTARRSDDLANVTGSTVMGSVGRSTAVDVSGDRHARERIRRLRASLQALTPVTDGRVILVAGATAGSYAPSVTARLAESFADAGRTVLVIDADLRAGALSSAVGINSDTGLAEYLTGGLADSPTQREWHGCRIIPAGHPIDDAPERLGSDAMRQLLAGAHADFDIVLIHAPCAANFADAAVVAANADGVVLIASWGSTGLPRARHIQDRLSAGPGSMLGWVLAGVPGYRLRSDADFVPAPH